MVVALFNLLLLLPSALAAPQWPMSPREQAGDRPKRVAALQDQLSAEKNRVKQLQGAIGEQRAGRFQPAADPRPVDLERSMNADESHSKISPWSATYADVQSPDAPSTFGAGPYNYMPTTSNIHLRSEQIGGTEGAPGGLEILGAGYDIIFGNPMGTTSGELDPGFRDPIVEHQFTYYHSWQESQNQPCGPIGGFFECPAGIRVRREYMCNHQSKADEVDSSKEMQDELGKQASRSVEAGFEAAGGYGPAAVKASGSASFSNSEAFKQSQTSMSEESKEFFDTMTMCTEFYVTYKKSHKPVYDAGFVATATELSNMPFEDCNVTAKLTDCSSTYRSYMDFIGTFGTDVVTAVELGAKRIHRIEMTKKDVTEMKSQGRDVAKEAAVSSSLGVTAAGMAEVSANSGMSASDSKSNSKQNSNSMSNKASNEYEINVGGLPSSDWREWAAGVADRAMPVRYEMAPMPIYLTKWPVEGSHKEGDAYVLPNYLAEAILSYSTRFGDNELMDLNDGKKKGLTTTGPGGKPMPVRLMGLIRECGARLDLNGGDFITRNVNDEGIKQIQFGKPFLEERPIFVGSIIYGNLNAFQPNFKTKMAVGFGMTDQESTKLLTYSDSQSYTSKIPEVVGKNLMVAFVGGINHEEAGKRMPFLLGQVTESATLASPVYAKYFAVNAEKGTGITSIELKTFMDESSPPALVLSSQLEAEKFQGGDDDEPEPFPVLCGLEYDEKTKFWKAFVAHGLQGFSFLATNTDDRKVAWALVGGSHQQDSMKFTNGMKIKKVKKRKDEKLMDEKGSDSQKMAARRHNAMVTMNRQIGNPGYLEMTFADPINFVSTPVCMTTQIFPNRKALDDRLCSGGGLLYARSVEKTCEGMGCDAIAEAAKTWCGVKTSSEWMVRHRAGAKKHYNFFNPDGIFSKSFEGTLIQCKAYCTTQQVETGKIISFPAPCVGFVRKRMTKDGKPATDEDVVECRGVADKDSFQSGKIEKEQSDEWDSYLYDEYPELDQCGDGSSAAIRGITKDRVAVETGDANGHPTMRAFAVVCVGEPSDSIAVDTPPDVHEKTCEDTPDFNFNTPSVPPTCDNLADAFWCKDGELATFVTLDMTKEWSGDGCQRPECNCKACGKCRGTFMNGTKQTICPKDCSAKASQKQASATFASLEGNTQVSEVKHVEGLTIIANGVTVVNQKETTSNGRSAVSNHDQQEQMQVNSKAVAPMRYEAVETVQKLESAADIESSMQV